MNNLVKVGRLGSVVLKPSFNPNLCRFSSTLQKGKVPISKEILEKRKLFQAQEGTPIYIKAGNKDKFLFISTMFLCGIGLICVGNVIYELGFIKKE